MNSTLLVLLVAGGVYALSRSENMTEIDYPVMQEMTVPAFQEESPVGFPAGETVLVNIADFAFQPAEIRIKAGTKIIWKNEDKVRHNAASDSGGFRGPLLAKGETYEYVFNKKGEFDYACDPHPWMKGRVIVE